LFRTESVRVAILSDTHGHVCPNVLAVVAECDIAVHAGDILTARVLQELHEVVDEVHAVRGNNDVPGIWAGDELEVLRNLPEVVNLALPGGLLIAEHGHAHGWSEPDLGKLRAAHPRARAIVYGHTHRLLIDREAEPWVLNPGAAGRIRNQGGPSCLVLHAAMDSWCIEEFKFRDSGPIGP
jgi:putative phosphoesterase